ncbi:MAG: hypothetical protein ABW143_09005 [Acidimicrobiales bacterium]
MAKTTANIRQYDGEGGGVYVAAVGTSAPAALAAPAVGWTELGWLSEDGVGVNREEERTERRAWQGNTLVKVVKTNTDTITFQCLEETATSLGLYYAGAELATAGGVTTVTVPTGGRSGEWALIADFDDPSGNAGAGITKRYVCALVDVGPGAEIASTQEGTVYEFTATILGEEFEIRTNNPAVVEES